jgi:hypothetical protein
LVISGLEVTDLIAGPAPSVSCHRPAATPGARGGGLFVPLLLLLLIQVPHLAVAEAAGECDYNRTKSRSNGRVLISR